MQNDNGIITGHFISHWGVPKAIRPRALQGISEFAILEFAPRGTRETWRYATNGMSSYAQDHPDKLLRIRTELYVCTKQQATWADDLLAAMATYPLDYTTYLGEGDTINVGQPLDRRSSAFTAVLLAGPGLVDPGTLGLVGGMSDNVLVHQVVGVFPAEAEYAEKHSGSSLWERLAKNGDLLLDDDSRLPVV
jgi:hypothetical protein